MTATHNTNGTVSAAPVLYLALDLGASSWKLAKTSGWARSPDSRRLPLAAPWEASWGRRPSRGREALAGSGPVLQPIMPGGFAGRVAPGDCSPGAPTDPDVRIPRI